MPGSPLLCYFYVKFDSNGGYRPAPRQFCEFPETIQISMMINIQDASMALNQKVKLSKLQDIMESMESAMLEINEFATLYQLNESQSSRVCDLMEHRLLLWQRIRSFPGQSMLAPIKDYGYLSLR